MSQKISTLSGSVQSHSPENWAEMFCERERRAGGLVPYFFSTVSNMWPFLSRVRSVTASKSRVLEIGCGPCFLSIWLSHLISDELSCWAMEYDEKVLEYANRNVRFFRAPVQLLQGDMFHLPFNSDSFDIIIHDGVFEHFTDEEIETALREQARVSRTIVFSVPVSRAKGHPDLYGDERLLGISTWKKLLDDTGTVTVENIYGSVPPRNILCQLLWYGMGRLGLRRYRTFLAKAAVFTLKRG